MKRLSALVASVAVLIGVVGGVVAYRSASSGTSVEQLVSADVTPEASETASSAPAEPKVKFKPCKKPAHREGKACVVEVVQDVILPAPASAGSGQTHSRDGGHHQEHANHDDDDQQQAAHESGDHEDEHGEDDGHDDGGEHEDD